MHIYTQFNIYKACGCIKIVLNIQKYSWNHESYASKSYPWTKEKLVKEPSVEIFILHWNSHIIWSLQQNVIMPVYNNKKELDISLILFPQQLNTHEVFFFLICFLVFHIDIHWLKKLTSCVAKWEGVENYLKV